MQRYHATHEGRGSKSRSRGGFAQIALAAAMASPMAHVWDGRLTSNARRFVSDKAEIKSLVLVIHADGLRLLLAGMLCEPIVDAACIYEQARWLRGNHLTPGPRLPDASLIHLLVSTQATDWMSPFLDKLQTSGRLPREPSTIRCAPRPRC